MKPDFMGSNLVIKTQKVCELTFFCIYFSNRVDNKVLT